MGTKSQDTGPRGRDKALFQDRGRGRGRGRGCGYGRNDKGYGRGNQGVLFK